MLDYTEILVGSKRFFDPSGFAGANLVDSFLLKNKLKTQNVRMSHFSFKMNMDL